MLAKKRMLVLDEEEIGILINVLNDFRNNLIKKGKESEIIDDVLLKVVYAPKKKIIFPRKYIEER